jgi:hypothetical protein
VTRPRHVHTSVVKKSAPVNGAPMGPEKCLPRGRALRPESRRERLDGSSAAAARPFSSDELTMPAQQRVGGDDRGNVAHDAAAQPMGQRGQTSSIGVGQPTAPPAQLAVQQAILFNQVGDHGSLATVQPAGDDHQQHTKCRDVDHGRESISQAKVTRPIQSWNTTGPTCYLQLPERTPISVLGGAWRMLKSMT